MFLHYSTKLRNGNVLTDICLSIGVSLLHALFRGMANSDTRSVLGVVYVQGVSLSRVWLPSLSLGYRIQWEAGGTHPTGIRSCFRCSIPGQVSGFFLFNTSNYTRIMKKKTRVDYPLFRVLKAINLNIIRRLIWLVNQSDQLFMRSDQ